MKDKILFILTGGTIDSYYDGNVDTAVPNRKSRIPEYLNSMQLYESFEFKTVCMKDSRKINETDRKKIINILKKTNNKRVIITHGTYTMPDTARYLEKHLMNKDKTIIVMGSMIPLYGFSPSDGPFNLAYAIAKVQDLDPGVYLSMNGRVFEPKEVIKELDKGKFVTLDYE